MLMKCVCMCVPYLFQLVYDELCIVERANLLVALSVDNGHSLQAHGLHGGLGRQQESMIEVVEELKTREKDNVVSVITTDPMLELIKLHL